MQLLLFLICYVGGIINSFILHRAYAYATYQLVYFFYPYGPYRWWSYSIPNIPYSLTVTLLMVTLYLINFKDCNRNRLMAAPQLVCAYILGLYVYAFNFFEPVNPTLHSNFSIEFVKMLITLSIAYKLINTDKTLNIIIFSYMGGASYIGLLVGQVGRNCNNRVCGIGTVDAPATNGMAAAIVPAVIFGLYWFWADSRLKSRIPVTIASALTFTALIQINSRGSFLGLVGGLGYLLSILFFSKIRRKNQRLNLVFLGLLGLACLASVLDQSAIDRFKTIGESTEVDEEKESGGTRMFFWVAAFELSKDYPFGNGFFAFPHFSDEYLPVDLDTGGNRARSVHSTWFQCLSEFGYPGLIIFITMLFFCFKTLNQCRKEASKSNNVELYHKFVAIEAALISYIIPMTFQDRFTAVIPYWLLMYSACAYNIHVVRKNESTN